jgi:nitrogen fixation protein FixH
MNETKSARSLWPVSIIGFFVVAIAFLATFIAWASRQREDLVADNYYDDEVRYQQRLDDLNRTLPLQSQIGVVYELTSQNIVITLPAAHAPVASGRIHLYRPSDELLDRGLPLALTVGGEQRLDARTLPKGLWKVRVEWTANGQRYFFDQSIVVLAQP